MADRTTSRLAVVLVALCTVFNTVGQSLWKVGMGQLKLDLWSLMTNVYLIGGFAIYGVNFVVLGYALRNGELSILYPVFSLGFVWVSLVSVFKFGEPFTVVNWFGLACIVTGVFLVTRAAGEASHES